MSTNKNGCFLKYFYRLLNVFFLEGSNMMMNKLCLISFPKNPTCTLVYATVSSRPYSQEIKTFNNPDVTNLRRGTGGRSSFNGVVATVFGASGFIGRFVCNQLGKRGTQLIIPYRGDPDDYSIKKLKLCGDLGQVLFQPFSLNDPVSIRKAIKYSNVVINLIGRNWETRNFDFYSVNVKGAREIAKACKELNIERFIHFSSLNLHQKPKRHWLKKLDFFPTKLEGEQAVFEEFPTATVFRPGTVYGYLDNFLWPLCNKKRHTNYSIPIWASGEKTIKQPVFAHDVSIGVVNAINNYETRGQIYQAVGPEKFYLKDIAQFCGQILQRHVVKKGKPLVHDIRYDPYFLIKLIIQNYIFGFAWASPRMKMCLEQFELESTSDIMDPNLPTLEDLGVTLSRLEDKIPHIILPQFLRGYDGDRMYNDFQPADSLSSKALSPFN